MIDKNPNIALHQILKAIAREKNGIPVSRVDIGQVRWGETEEESRIFGISSGIGLDAIVCKKALHSKLKKVLNKIHLGKLTYLLLTVSSLFSMKTAEVTLECGDNHCVHKMNKMIFAAAMNLRAEGGGVPMAPKASPRCINHSKSTDSLMLRRNQKWQTEECEQLRNAVCHTQ